MVLYGADVSQYQGSDVSGIVNDNDIIIVKVSEGAYYVNPYWKDQASTVINSGKKLGLYHFINAGVDNNTQAQYFLDNAGEYATRSGVALILDFENNPDRTKYPTLTGNEPKAIADYIDDKTGKTTWLYIGYADIQSGYKWDDMKERPLWVADYPKNDGSAYTEELQNWVNDNHFNKLKYWSTITMWQYDSKPYDRSVFYGDNNKWSLLTKNGQENQNNNYGGEDNNEEGYYQLKNKGTGQEIYPKTKWGAIKDKPDLDSVIKKDGDQTFLFTVSPNGTKFAIIVDNDGNIKTKKIQ